MCSGTESGRRCRVFRGATGTPGASPGERVLIAGLSLSGDPGVHGDYLRTLEEGGEDPFMAELFEDCIPRGGAVSTAALISGTTRWSRRAVWDPRGR